MAEAKALLKDITPPVLWKAVRDLRTASRRRVGALFEGDDAMFEQLASTSCVYFEYGCGASTKWMMPNTDSEIYSVDTSGEWLDHVRKEAGNSDRLHLHHTDLGPLKAWGTPIGYSRCERFSDYADWPWQQGVVPNLILVDGRFRVCCFLTCLRNGAPGTPIIFDDYGGRPHYAFVERKAQDKNVET